MLLNSFYWNKKIAFEGYIYMKKMVILGSELFPCRGFAIGLFNEFLCAPLVYFMLSLHGKNQRGLIVLTCLLPSMTTCHLV